MTTATVRPTGTTLIRGRLPQPAMNALPVAVPLAWGVALLFHPTGDGEEFYPILRDQVTPWLAVHLATLLFLPSMAVVMLLLLRGTRGIAARVSRVALAVFAIAYTAWEAMIGIGTGLLVDEVNQLGAAERVTGAELVERFTGHGVLRALEYTGSVAWLAAVVAAAMTWRGAIRLGRIPIALLVLSAPLVTIHVPPFGPVGLAMFIGAVLAILRGRRAHGLDLELATSGA